MTQTDDELARSAPEQALRQLEADAGTGLSDAEALRRIEHYGENRIETERRSRLAKFFSHFWGPIPWMIEVAAVLSAAVQRWEDFGVIFLMLLINGGVSFWEENKAQNAIEALRSKLAPEARVRRNGEWRTIEARKLVPGDVVKLQIGNVVPADAKLLQQEHLAVDESALTGESLPVSKDPGDDVYSGTSVKQGEATLVVTATGMATKFAKTVELVSKAEHASHFQRAVLRIGHFLIGTTAVLVMLIVVVGIWRGGPVTELLLFALVLTIAGIPQALPAVLTVTMTVGAHRLAQRKAIVSNLASLEELAGLRVLCSDKTGTLTKNELELQSPVVIDAEDDKDLIVAAALTARHEGADPIDRAILGALEHEGALRRYEVQAFRPFDPTRKRAEVDLRTDRGTVTIAKGAPQIILDLARPDETRRGRIAARVDELADNGFRALGVARKEPDGTWSYLGLLPLLDPPREDSAEVVQQALAHGIDVRMVTGDHVAIAKQVARQVGLDPTIHEASELVGEPESEPRESEGQADECSLRAEIFRSGGFAQVTPEHKFRLVRRFQSEGTIVGMTGDGVNDAPALKQADVGIAVSGATDAARAAADLVLTAPGLGVIADAVDEARRIFERMTSYSTFRITETMRVLLFMSLSILAFNFYPVTPIMIVLLAILNDIPIMTIATDNAKTARRPVRWDFTRVLAIATVLSVAGVIATFLLFWYLQQQLSLDESTIQTIIFLKLLVAGHMTIYLTRTVDFFWSKPYPNLWLILALEGTQVAGTLVAVYGWLVAPIGWGYALAVWGYAIVWMVVNDALKVVAYRSIQRWRAHHRAKAASPLAHPSLTG